MQNKKSSLCRLKINPASGSESCIYSWHISTHGSKQGRWRVLKRGGTLVAKAAAAPTTMSPAASDCGGGREGGGVFSPVRAVLMTASTVASNSWSDSSGRRCWEAEQYSDFLTAYSVAAQDAAPKSAGNAAHGHWSGLLLWAAEDCYSHLWQHWPEKGATL